MSEKDEMNNFSNRVLRSEYNLSPKKRGCLFTIPRKYYASHPEFIISKLSTMSHKTFKTIQIPKEPILQNSDNNSGGSTKYKL